MDSKAWKIDQSKKVIFIGDVHGHLKTLEALLATLKLEYPDHKIVFLGDLIDKGKNSKDVVQLVKDNYDCILGNHDRHMGAESHPSFWKHYESLWLLNGGRKTIKEYGDKYKIKNISQYRSKFQEHYSWIKTLPLVIEYPNIKINNRILIAAHAPLDQSIETMGGLENYKKLLTKDTMFDFWKKYLKSYYDYSRPEMHSNEEKAVSLNLYRIFEDINDIKDIPSYFQVSGHNHNQEVKKNDYINCIDTKVYGPNKLTAFITPENKYISQETID